MTSEKELLPCPFCGSEAKLEKGGEYRVQCTKTGCCYGQKTGHLGYTFRKDAIELWNRRTK